MKIPHKHTELIKAWADGAEIELLHPTMEWCQAPFPSWDLAKSYRIKPEPKPDVTLCRFLYTEGGYLLAHRMVQNARIRNEVKFTFDGETGKLKAVELI